MRTPPVGRTVATVLCVWGAATALNRATRAVEGHSMAPTLLPGDRVLVVPRPARAGDVVVLTDPRPDGREVIKRIARVGDDGYDVRGDLPEASTDSREYGPVPVSAVTGVVVWRWWPPARLRRP